MKKLYTLFFILISLSGFSTTYYWNGGNTTHSWTTAGNWNTTLGGGGSSRTVPDVSDILIFDGTNLGANYTGAVTVNGLQAETVNSLIIQNNATVTFNSSTTNSSLTGTLSRAAAVSIASTTTTMGSVDVATVNTNSINVGSFITAGSNVLVTGSNIITAVNAGVGFSMASPAVATGSPGTAISVSQPIVFTAAQSLSVGDYVFTGTSTHLGQVTRVIDVNTILGQGIDSINSTSCKKVTSILTVSSQFSVSSGATFNMSCTTPFVLKLASGAVGTVNGTVAFGASTNRIFVDNGGTAKLSFRSGSNFDTGSSVGSPFGSLANATNDCVVFESGSSYTASANPSANSQNGVFGANTGSSVVSFQTGSNYIHNSTYNPLNFYTRGYPNFVVAAGTYAFPAATPMDNVTINSGLSITMNSNSYQIIKGNLTIGSSATLSASTQTPVFVFCGSSTQTVSGTGTLSGNGLCKIIVTPNSTFTLGRNLSQGGTTGAAYTYNLGTLDFGNYTISNTDTYGSSTTVLKGYAASSATTTTGTVVAGSPYMMVVSSLTGFNQGMEVTGTGIPANTIITYPTGNIIYLSNPLPAGSYTVTANYKSDGATFLTANTGGLVASYPLPTYGVLSANSCNYTFNASSAQVMGASFPSTVNNLTINNSAGVTTNASMTVSGALALTSGDLTTGATTLTLAGATSGSGNIVTSTTGTVAYTGTAQTISNLASNTVNNLTVNNAAGTFTMGGALTVNGTLTLTNGSLATGANTLTLRGTVSGSTAKIATSTTGTVDYGCSGSIGNIFTSATVNNLIINSSIALSSAATLNNTLTLTTGTLSSANNLTFGTGATIIRTDGALSSTPVFSGTVNVTYNSTSNTTTGSELPTSSSALNNLTINDAAGVSLNANATVNGSLALTSGDISLDVSSRVLTLKGSTSGTGNIVTGTHGTVYYGGSSAQTISNLTSNTAYRLTIDNAAGVTMGSSISVGNLLTLTSGQLNTGANTLSLSGTVTYTAGKIATSTTGTVSYSATTHIPDMFTSGTVNNLTINTGATLAADLIIGGTLTLNAANLTSDVYSLTLKGATTVNTSGTISSASGGTIVYNGSSAQTIDALSTGGSNIYNLVINNASGVSLAQSLTVNTALTLTSGILSMANVFKTLTINGTTSGAGSIDTGTSGSGISYCGSTPQTISNIYNNTAYKITVNNTAGVALGAAVSIGSNLYLTAGQLDNSTFNITIPSGKVLNRAAGTLAVAPVFGTGMSLNYNGSTNIASGVEMPSSTTALNTLTIATTGGATITLNANVTVNATLILTSGTLDNSSYAVNIPTTKAITRAAGTITNAPVFAGTVTLTYNGSSQTTTGPEMPSSTSALSNLTISNAAGVVMNASITVNNTLNFTSGSGDFTTGANTLTFAHASTSITSTNSGKVITSNNGTVVYKGGTAQHITDHYNGAVNNLIINSSGNITLDAALTVGGTLTLTAGKLSLGANDLTIGAAASLSGGTSSNYIVTDGVGKFTQTASTGVDKLFPIGISTASYDPATLNSTSTVAYSIKVGSSLSGTPNNSSLANLRQWDIAPASGTPTATLTLTPSVASHVSTPVMGRYSGGVWNQMLASVSGSSFTATYSSFPSSSFATGTNLAFRSQYVISTSASNGSVTGAGSFDGGATATLTPTANGGYRFVNWTVGGTQASTANPYVFTVSADQTVVANFATPTITVAGTTLTSTFADCPTCDVTVNGTGTLNIDQARTMHDVTLNTGGKLLVSTPLTINNLVFKADQTTSFSANLAANVTIAGTVKFLKTMDDTKWYFMSFPCDILISDIKLSNGSAVGTLNTDWFIKYYDGAQRIQNLGTATNWKNASPSGTGSETLTAFKGYIFGLGNVGQVEIMFPIVKDSVKNEPARVIPVVAYGDGVVNNNLGNPVSDTNKGWNLVGQPYFSKYNGTGTNLTYLNIFEGNAYTTYYKTDASTIFPFSAYFVQADAALATSKITFALNSRLSAPASVSNNLTDMVQINVTTPTGTDKTNLIIDENESPLYQINHDMEKWLTTGTETPQIYSLLDGVKYAYNALPVENVQDLPLALYTRTAGSTTIAAVTDAPINFSQLLLTDNQTSTVTDLMTSSYSFDASAGINTSRFRLSAVRVATAATSIRTKFSIDGPVVSTLDGKLMIANLATNTNIRVYDVMGRMVASKLSATSTMEIPLSTNGVYTVQLDSQKGSWTKKALMGQI